MHALVGTLFMVVAASIFASVPASGAFGWQGFDYGWLRKDLGFETPHRFGTFSSRFSNVSVDTSLKGSGLLHAAFTPGVNGDFSHPKTFFRTIGQPQSPAVEIDVKEVCFVGTDYLDNQTNTAFVQLSEPVTIHLAEIGNQAGITLNGISIDMSCVNDTGYICNSQSAWVSTLNVSISCDDTVSTPSVSCEVSFFLVRSWTPSHGGGKPLSTSLRYSVCVDLLVVEGPPHQLQAVLDEPISASGNIFATPSGGERFIRGPSPTGVTPGLASAPPFTSAFTGITSFGYQLEETGGRPLLGRYMERLTFAVRDGGFDSTSNTAAFNWTAGFSAPSATVYASDVRYHMQVLGVFLSASSLPLARTQQAGSAAVCMDDRAFPYTFKCSAKGMKDSTTDVLLVNV